MLIRGVSASSWMVGVIDRSFTFGDGRIRRGSSEVQSISIINWDDSLLASLSQIGSPVKSRKSR